MTYETIAVERQGSITFLEMDRPQASNTISSLLVAECHDALSACEESATIIVLRGSKDVFCLGADFKALVAAAPGSAAEPDVVPGPLYDLWLRLATGAYVTIADVRGKVNAGGVGFAAACDVVLADESAQFGLSELLFGLYPACVLPFLMRRIGFQRAHYLTLMTQPITASQARDIGLVDACEPDSQLLLRRHLQRLGRLSKSAVSRYKRYASSLCLPSLQESKSRAVAANGEMFSDAGNLRAIARYVEQGIFPWERS